MKVLVDFVGVFFCMWFWVVCVIILEVVEVVIVVKLLDFCVRILVWEGLLGFIDLIVILL